MQTGPASLPFSISFMAANVIALGISSFAFTEENAGRSNMKSINTLVSKNNFIDTSPLKFQPILSYNQEINHLGIEIPSPKP